MKRLVAAVIREWCVNRLRDAPVRFASGDWSGLRFLVLAGLLLPAARLEADPVDATEVVPQRLARWRFHSEGLTNDLGSAPLASTASRRDARRPAGLAFQARAGRTEALRYPLVWSGSTGARTNFNLSSGTIRFTYFPDWYHGDRSDSPGEWCRLLECGSWALSVDPSGRHLVFQTPASDGSVATNFVAEFPSGPVGAGIQAGWEITLSYKPSRCWVSIGDTLAAFSPAGPQALPPAAVRELGVCIGSGAGGAFPAQGTISDLESFNGVADSRTFAPSHLGLLSDPRVRRAQWLSASDTGAGIRLTWERGWEGDPQTNSAMYGISRRLVGTSDWSLVVPSIQEQAWTDTGVVPGEYYEYRIGRNPTVPAAEIPTIFAARRGAAIDRRGRAILVVDETVAEPLNKELAALRRDLRADGWTVVSTNVPRHADLSYPYPNAYDYTNRCVPLNAIRSQRIKAFIRSQYQEDVRRTNVVFLIGHVPLPYSGFDNSVDGHADHTGAFPADSWYGDMTGLWSDRITRESANVINRNIAGDGRLDQDTLPREPDGSPGRLEVPVGRIDFSYMETLAGGRSLAATELRLYRAYFEKVARWRRGQLPAEDRFRAWTTTDARFFRLIPTVLRLQSRLWGEREISPSELLEDTFRAPATALWGIHGDFGGFDAVGTPGGATHHPVSRIAQGGAGAWPQAMFTLYFGSYFGEWFHWKDDLLRTLLAAPDSVLTTTWLDIWDGTVWRADRFHLGAPYAAALQDTFAAHAGVSCRTTAILGDPFLREHPLAPVPGLSMSSKGGAVVLTWPSHPAAAEGFRLYRRPRPGVNEHAEWLRVADLPAGSTRYEDHPAGNEAPAYMIKAMALKSTGSGSYINLSLGTTTENATRRR